jgi:predicted NBD/HSP70 family sugar kinase
MAVLQAANWAFEGSAGLISGLFVRTKETPHQQATNVSSVWSIGVGAGLFLSKVEINARASHSAGKPAVAGSRGPRSSLTLAEHAVLAAFTGPDACTRARLAELTGLSRAVVAALVETLVARGELTQANPRPAGARGRPSVRYQRSAFLPPVLLITLRHDTSTVVSLVEKDGSSGPPRLAQSWDSPWERWAAALGVIAGQLTANASAKPRLVVVAAPFPVRDGEGQPRVHALSAGPRKMPRPVAPQSGWLTKDPRPAIAGLVGCPVIMVNDANLAALGEARFGAGRGYKGVMHLMVRDGIGAGLVYEGRLFTGAHGFAGELAHTQLVEEGDFCVCGSRGCLCTVAHGPGVLRALAEIHGLHLTFAELQALIARGNPVMLRYFRDLGAMVARPVATLTTLIDPDCIIVDASLEGATVPFIAGLTEELTHRSSAALMSRLTVAPGTLRDATAFGAIAAADAVTQSAVTGAPLPFTPASPLR